MTEPTLSPTSKPPSTKIERVCFVRTGQTSDVASFDRAINLCKRTGAELGIVRLVDDEPPGGLVGLFATWSIGADVISNASSEAEELDRLVDQARAENVRARRDLVRGSIIELLQYVTREKYDLLVKSAEPVFVVREMLFGRSDRVLFRRCPCPVWIERPTSRPRVQRVLAAVDPAPSWDDEGPDPLREGINHAILDLASLLAKAEDAELHVTHVWPFHFEGHLHARAGLSPEQVLDVGAAIRRRHEDALARLTRDYVDDVAREHLLKGDPGHEISQLATNEKFDVVVMGTAMRTGMLGFLMGSTAESVLDNVNCSVVAIKPPGFRPPQRGE